MTRTALFSTIIFFTGFTFGQTEVYFEDFQTGLPVSYTIVDNDGMTPHPVVAEYSDAWIAVTDPGDVNDTIMGSTSYFSPSGQADRWLITPSITLGSFGNTLSWEAKSHDPSFPDSYKVFVSVTDTQLSSFTDTLLAVISETAEWNLRTIDLSELGLNNQTIYVAFVNQTNDGFKLYVDDIRVVVEDPVGLTELKKNNFNVHPNPATSKISIPYFENVESIEIISITGKHVIQSKQQTIDVSKLDNGQYIVRIRQKGQFIYSTFIKD